MAVDQTSLPKDLRPLNLNRTSALRPPGPSNSSSPPSNPRSEPPVPLPLPSGRPLRSAGLAVIVEEGEVPLQLRREDPPPAERRRPRYVGGQTRIVSVRRDVSFREIVRKMTDVYGGGGGGHRQAVAIKYQLPDEDLDALVSVSGAEDLENMMEEYEKLPPSPSSASSSSRPNQIRPSL
ncbi:hypothetical protein QJS10_CPA02g01208 [Acorus calamus]|uniref:PB1 domain-containing protein n=1 Tax=Acorus calamus TaxID=4465 RepID=A0AAV9FAZ3_ACOCL|nr:hypothetical protein QJS10_CPA02g01208 [Acorus calamus]